jgi:DNA-directed RNA polymerase specialized sigma24 family protein
MLWSMFRRRRLADEAWRHLADLYRVAFFLVGDQSIAEELIENVYAYVHRNRRAMANDKRLRTEMVRLLLSRAESIPPIHPEAGQSSELAALSRLPYPLRMPLVLDAIGMDAEEIAAATGLGALEVIARQQIGWDLLCEAFSDSVTSC